VREKGIDGRHAEADSLGFGNQPGTIRERKRVYPSTGNFRFARHSGAIAEVVSLLLRPCLFLLTVVNYK